MDGASFIRASVRTLYKLSECITSKTIRVREHTIHPSKETSRKTSRKMEKEKEVAEAAKSMPVPPTFSHFVMNLPASAIDFLHAFIGLYEFNPSLAEKYPLPMVHVHCFHKHPDQSTAHSEILKRIQEQIQFELPPEELKLEDIRLVAPNKNMYCASFRLPKEVLLAKAVPLGGEDVSEYEKSVWSSVVDEEEKGVKRYES